MITKFGLQIVREFVSLGRDTRGTVLSENECAVNATMRRASCYSDADLLALEAAALAIAAEARATYNAREYDGTRGVQQAAVSRLRAAIAKAEGA